MTDDPKQKIKLVLTKILNEHYLGAESANFLELRIERILTNTNVERDVFVRIIENLKEKGIITKYSFWKMNKDGNEMKISYDRDPKWNLCTISLPKSFREISEEYISELSDTGSQLTLNSGLILYLDSSGNFWHGNKDDFCYSMGATKNRLLIIRHLVKNRGFQSTDLLASILGGKQKQNIRTEIAKIKQNIKNHLNLEDVIESKKDSGYQINPNYKVIEVN